MSEAEVLIKSKIEQLASQFDENASMSDVIYSLIFDKKETTTSIRDSVIHSEYIRMLKSNEHRSIHDIYIELSATFDLAYSTVKLIILGRAKM